MSCTITLHLILLGQSLSLSPELGFWSTVMPTILLSPLPPHSSGLQAATIPSFLPEYWGFELRSSCSWSKLSHPLSQLPSPGSVFSFYNYFLLVFWGSTWIYVLSGCVGRCHSLPVPARQSPDKSAENLLLDSWFFC